MITEDLTGWKDKFNCYLQDGESNICNSLQCRKLSKGTCYDVISAAEGTACGDNMVKHMKWFFIVEVWF